MDAQSHSEIVHFERLNSLCRICGCRSKRQKDIRKPKLCKNYKDELEQFHGITVSSDTDGVYYSSTLCTKCYTSLTRLKSSKSPSDRTLQSSREMIEKCKHMWTSFNPAVSVTDCTVCSVFTKQSGGGRQQWG